ncbi:MAG: hypothetical protein J5714_04685 [Alphaproteobacteria bacterium]|nr:hypothetical protein [Alphaproteobacteria bacterium]
MGKVLKFCSVLCFFPTVAGAYPTGTQFGVGVSATTGMNAFTGYVNKDAESFWGKRFGYRIDFAGTKIVRSGINSAANHIIGDRDVEVGDSLSVKEFEIEAKHFGGMVDFYPFGNTWFLGAWRISGGYYGGQFDATARVVGGDEKGEFCLGRNRYKYMDGPNQASATANWKYDGPYVGTGFDLGVFAGFKIYFDAGVVFTRKVAKLSLDVPSDDLYKWNGADWALVDPDELAADVEDTRHDAQSELDKVKYFPIVKLGLMYRF